MSYSSERKSRVESMVSEAIDLTFSNLRKTFGDGVGVPVYGAPAAPSRADTLAAQRMAAAGGGYSPAPVDSEKPRKSQQKTKAPEQENKSDTEEQSWFGKAIDTAQSIADIGTFAGSFVPGANLIAGGIQGASSLIDLAQGQKGQAAMRGVEAAVSAIPGGRLLTTAGKAARVAGRVAPTGMKALMPVFPRATRGTKAAFKVAGIRALPTTGIKLGVGLPLLASKQGQGAAPATEKQDTAQDQQAPATQPAVAPAPAPKKPSSAFVYRHEDGKVWSQGLSQEEVAEKIKGAQAAEARRKAAQPTTQKKGLTVPRKPSGEVDYAAWEVMTGMKTPKTYDETKRAIEVTKPYGYDPTTVDPSLKSRYEKVRQQVQQNMTP